MTENKRKIYTSAENNIISDILINDEDARKYILNRGNIKATELNALYRRLYKEFITRVPDCDVSRIQFRKKARQLKYAAKNLWLRNFESPFPSEQVSAGSKVVELQSSVDKLSRQTTTHQITHDHQQFDSEVKGESSEDFADHSYSSFPGVNVSFHEGTERLLDGVCWEGGNLDQETGLLHKKVREATVLLEVAKLKRDTERLRLEREKIEMETAKMQKERASDEAITARIQKELAVQQYKKVMGFAPSDNLLEMCDGMVE